MRCWSCFNATTVNAMDALGEEDTDALIDHFGMVAMRGSDDMFDSEGRAIICEACVKEGLEEHKIETRG